MNSKFVSSIDAVARSRLVTIDANATLVDAARMLSDTQISLVVDDDFNPMGVVNARNALRALLVQEKYEESLLRDYVMGVGYL